jgi:4a-hydroxytetrahydrobiopterin dehydratase
MERRLLSDDQVAAELGKLDGWSVRGKSIVRKFEFGNFADALAFINKAGEIADAADHHPDIRLGWGYAEFEITTHDRGGVTDVDFALAKKIDEIQG